jgi:tetratricopeptide (TPR) repeat protein
VLTAVNNLAANAQARRRLAESERLYRRALAMKETQFGDRHPTIGTTLNNLAVLLKQRGKYEEANASFRRALAIFERTLGSRHANTAACLDNYAQLLRAMRRSSLARQLERRASRIRRGIATLSDDNVAVTATLNPQYTGFRLSVKPSPIHRWGVHAEERIPKGRKVIEYAGERVGRTAAARRARPDKVYVYALRSGPLIDGASGGSGAEFINHSCDPNLVARENAGRLNLFSRRPIAAGEELTVDYKFRRDMKKVACRCGAPNCRGTINVL